LRPTRIRDYKMKLFIKITLLLTLVVGLFLTSCDKEEFKIGFTVLGKVVATPSIVANGEELTLKIEGNISASGEATINGKKYYPVVHYLLDGKEVATSSETSLPFNAKCIIKDLETGEHTISVEVIGSQKEVIVENKVTSTNITVQE